MKYNTAKGYLFAVVSAIIYGCMPLMAKNIYADGVTPVTLVFLRNFFSLLPLAILAHKEKNTIKIPLKLLPSISLISLLGCCVTPMLLFSSYQFIPSGTATVFHFIYPAVVVISEILFLKNKVQTGNVISVLLCVAGISFFYSPGEPINFVGSALALLSGITFACYVILLSHFDNRNVSGFLFCFYVAVISSIASLIICIGTNSLMLPSSLPGWGLCVLFSLLVTTGAVALFQQSAFLIGSERASILSTLEPITGVLIGAIVFGESCGPRTVIGSILNEMDNHFEQSELTEESLSKRAAVQQEPLDELVFERLQHQKLHKAISKLPELQRRRLVLYYFGGYTYEQIARIEGCSKVAVKYTIDKAIDTLKKFL